MRKLFKYSRAAKPEPEPDAGPEPGVVDGS